MVVRVRTELTGENMAILYKQHSPHSVPLGGNGAWANIVVHDDDNAIVPWSIIFSCYLAGSYWVKVELGDLELPQGIVVKNSTLRLAVMPSFRDLKYNRWRLFDETGY